MKEVFNVNAYIDKVEIFSGASVGSLIVTDDYVEYKTEGLIGKSESKNFRIPVSEITAVKHLSGSMFVIVRNNSKVYYVSDTHMIGVSTDGVSTADSDIIAIINKARNNDSSDIPLGLMQEIEKVQKSNKALWYIGCVVFLIFVLYILFS